MDTMQPLEPKHKVKEKIHRTLLILQEVLDHTEESVHQSAIRQAMSILLEIEKMKHFG